MKEITKEQWNAKKRHGYASITDGQRKILDYDPAHGTVLIPVKVIGLRTTKKQSTPMLCVECDHKFRKIIGSTTFEVRCPKCHGYDTEPI